jgi:hypothetical protein
MMPVHRLTNRSRTPCTACTWRILLAVTDRLGRPCEPMQGLDVDDNSRSPQCEKLADAGLVDPCATVQNGPLIFQSQRRATQSFSGHSKWRMTVMIAQKRTHQTIADLPPSAKFPLHEGRLFDVLRHRSSVAARLECSMVDGGQPADISTCRRSQPQREHFVNASEPTFDILTYRVMP